MGIATHLVREEQCIRKALHRGKEVSGELVECFGCPGLHHEQDSGRVREVSASIVVVELLEDGVVVAGPVESVVVQAAAHESPDARVVFVGKLVRVLPPCRVPPETADDEDC